MTVLAFAWMPSCSVLSSSSHSVTSGSGYHSPWFSCPQAGHRWWGHSSSVLYKWCLWEAWRTLIKYYADSAPPVMIFNKRPNKTIPLGVSVCFWREWAYLEIWEGGSSLYKTTEGSLAFAWAAFIREQMGLSRQRNVSRCHMCFRKARAKFCKEL